MLELEAEFRAGSYLGIGVIGGIGQLTVQDNLGNSDRLAAYEAGAQLIVYPLEPFKSLELGAELLYLKVKSDAAADIIGVAEGLAVGPLVGYKLIAQGGFTFFVQGGFEYVALRADAQSTSTGATATNQESRFLPLLNLNLGWSF